MNGSFHAYQNYETIFMCFIIYANKPAMSVARRPSLRKFAHSNQSTDLNQI